MKRLSRLSLLVMYAAVSACQSSQPSGMAEVAPSGRAVVAAVAKEDGGTRLDAGPALPIQGSTQQATTPDAAMPDARMAVVQLPTSFMGYSSQPIGDGKLCIVGAVTDDDGMNEKPVVYVADAHSKQILWLEQLPVPPDTYQSRATHCNRKGEALFVLLQSDTQPQQTLSQTLLRVVRLDSVTGSVQTQQGLDVLGAYTAWVDEGANRFQWMGNELMVTATYRLNVSDGQQASITLRLNPNLTPASGGKP